MQDTFARATHSAGRPSAARNGIVSCIQIVVLCLNKIFLSENYPLDMLYRILNIFNVFAKFPTRNTTLYTRYPIVARALGLAAAFRPSASREQRYLAYKIPL